MPIYAKEKLEPQLVFNSEDGRILMIEIKKKYKCLVVSLYAPNALQEIFYEDINIELIKKEYEYCLIGDLNAVFDCLMDCKSGKIDKKSGLLLPKTFLKIADEFNLVDVRRTKNPLTRDYSFFLQWHNSWSRIDTCWASTNQLSRGSFGLFD